MQRYKQINILLKEITHNKWNHDLKMVIMIFGNRKLQNAFTLSSIMEPYYPLLLGLSIHIMENQKL